MEILNFFSGYFKRKKIRIGNFFLKLDISNPHEREYLKSIKNNDFSIAQSIINKDDKVLDLGANIGFTALLYLKFGAEEVCAFEPIPELAKRIRNIRTNQIKVFDFAVGDRQGTENIYLSTTHNQGHSLNEEWPVRFSNVFKEKKILQIKMTTLDCVFKEEIFDFVKIDVEGMEEKTIIGGEMFFQRNKNAIVQVEIYDWQFENTHRLLSKLYAYAYVPIIENYEVVQFKRIFTLEESNKLNFNGPPNYIYSNRPLLS
jgi:FkbM family methyltransferase